MLIGEIAHLAQVTPRAVRHYHRIGLLPEPERRPNGYRVYSVTDLTRLLRIRSLIVLGFSLDRVGAMVKSAPERTAATELKELEVALREQIHVLDRQLEVVLGAQASSMPEALPLYNENHEALEPLLSDPQVRQIETDISLLFAATLDTRLLERIRIELADPARVESLANMAHQLRAISDTSTEGERDDTIAALRAGISGIENLHIADPALRGLFEDYVNQAFSRSQLDVLRRAFPS